jgi:hypothetical protein
MRSGVATSSFHLGPIVQTSNMTPQRPIEFTNADFIRGYGADDGEAKVTSIDEAGTRCGLRLQMTSANALHLHFC